MDVKTAFLNGDMDEDIYMTLSAGSVGTKYPEYVSNFQ